MIDKLINQHGEYIMAEKINELVDAFNELDRKTHSTTAAINAFGEWVKSEKEMRQKNDNS